MIYTGASHKSIPSYLQDNEAADVRLLKAYATILSFIFVFHLLSFLFYLAFVLRSAPDFECWKDAEV